EKFKDFLIKLVGLAGISLGFKDFRAKELGIGEHYFVGSGTAVSAALFSLRIMEEALLHVVQDLFGRLKLFLPKQGTCLGQLSVIFWSGRCLVRGSDGTCLRQRKVAGI